jgi:sigma-B regulation protein RsbU (phosphoserine phosphatase)
VLVAVDGQIETVGRPGSLLGVIPDIDVVAAPVSLDRGQTLLMYTDGVTEARRDGEFFSDTGLHAAASRHADGPEALVAGVLAEVLDFQGGTAYDDIALVAIRLG